MDFSSLSIAPRQSLEQYALEDLATSPLSEEQRDIARQIIETRKCFLITGNAGTGKSFLLNWLRSRLTMQITASTGIAALQIKGGTIHSWAGLGIGNKPAGQIVESLLEKRFKYKDKTYDRIRDCQRLVIDEVSMLGADLIDLLDAVCCIVRENEEPFGGIQVILVGDFCLVEGTEVIMFDGSLRKVEDIRMGDEVMGPDFKPRKVLRLFAGRAPMYHVEQTNGNSYVVTGNHEIPMMRRTRGGSNAFRYPDLGDRITVKAKELVGASSKFLEVFGGYKSGAIQFPKRDVTIEPYFLGVWLGDGEAGNTRISNPDSEIIDYLKGYAESQGLLCTVVPERPDTPCFRISLTGGPRVGNTKNPIREALRDYGVMSNKHIPEDFLVNDEDTRLELLAGLLDTDGCWAGNRYIITLSNTNLMQGVSRLANQLGFRCRVIDHVTGASSYKEGSPIQTLTIGGDTWRIPCKVARKQSCERALGHSRMNSTLKVTPHGEGAYAGFELSGDRMFLLADGTVSHNCQIPPVTKGKDLPVFAFEADAWEAAGVKVFLLTKVFRQEEELFARVLNKLRFDEIDEEVEEFLMSRYEAEDEDPEHPPVVLHTHNHGCDRINRIELRKIPGDERVFTAEDEGKHEGFIAQLDKDCMAPKALTLKVGARVMLLINLNPAEGLVNGSLGFVREMGVFGITVEFDNGKSHTLDRETWAYKKGDDVLATRTQYPLRLAWGITTHKAQGMTLAKVEAHLDQCFADGQAYVALSRAQTSAGLFLRGKGISISANKKAVDFYKRHCK